MAGVSRKLETWLWNFFQGVLSFQTLEHRSTILKPDANSGTVYLISGDSETRGGSRVKNNLGGWRMAQRTEHAGTLSLGPHCKDQVKERKWKDGGRERGT